MPAHRLTSLILPTYNPGSQLTQTLHELRRFLDDTPGSWEVLFVCDGCTDGTTERLHQVAGAEGWLRVLDHRPNRGKGYAVRRGLAAARGSWRVFTDVDLAYPPSEIMKVAQRLWAGDDVVIATRNRVLVPPRLHGYAWKRQVQSRLFSGLARTILPLPYRDTQAGLKGFSAAAVRQLLPHLHCDGFGFDCELLSVCDRLGLAVTEEPVSVRFQGTATTTGWRAAWATLQELWQVRRQAQCFDPIRPLQPLPTPQPAARQGVPL